MDASPGPHGAAPSGTVPDTAATGPMAPAQPATAVQDARGNDSARPPGNPESQSPPADTAARAPADTAARVNPEPNPPASAERQALAFPVILVQAKVIDTARIRDARSEIAVYGIEGLPGEPAAGLQAFLDATADGRITCQAQGDSGSVCLTQDGTDIAQVALVNGAARTRPDAPESYRQQEAAAQAARRGIWVNLPPPPQTVAHPVVVDTATLTAGGQTFLLDGITGFPMPYSGQLQGYIIGAGDSITCSPQSYPGYYICVAPDGTDIAKVALVNGAAQVAPDAPDAYRLQQLDAINNRRGYWLNASDQIVTAALVLPEQPHYVLVSGDDGVDGISYVGGAPVAVVDGQSVFLVYSDGPGWGYYDHNHNWRGAPERYQNHMEHFHPGGHGLRGHDGSGRREGPAGRDNAMRHEDGLHRDAGPRRDETMHPGGHPGITNGPPGMHPGPAVSAARPSTVATSGGHPGVPGQVPGGTFMHPGPAASAGGFHPGMPAPSMHAAAAPAPAMHAAPAAPAPAMHSAPAAPHASAAPAAKHK